MPNPEVPETLEGWAVLHQMYRVRWAAWRALPEVDRRALSAEAAEALAALERRAEGPSACFSLLGHKGDLMLLHFRRTFDELVEAELGLGRLGLCAHLEPTTSYLSVVELGLYEATLRTAAELRERGVEPGTPEWAQAFAEMRTEMRGAMKGRLFPPIPARRYLCFYPMDKRRGEAKNWYRLPIAERGAMMREHGVVGRGYAGRVTQIISGSIGFDDWEWGVDLFADDPLVFKKLVYEMRFDEASAEYGLFGAFYLGLRFAARDLPRWLDGELPGFAGEAGAAPAHS